MKKHYAMKFWKTTLFGISALCFILGFFLASYVIGRPSVGHFYINNQSGETIIDMEVFVGRTQFRFYEINDAVSFRCIYPISGEGGYRVRVILSSGKIMEKYGGYITRGMTFSDALVILPDEIRILTGVVKEGLIVKEENTPVQKK